MNIPSCGLSRWCLSLFLLFSAASLLMAQDTVRQVSVCDPFPDDPPIVLFYLRTTDQAVDGLAILRSRLVRIDTLDRAITANIVQKRLPYEENFTEKNSGSLAVASYRLFHEYGSRSQYDTAAMYYQLAGWLRNRWVACDAERLRDVYRSAERAVRENRLDGADSTVFVFYQTAQSRPGWAIVGDSLKNLFSDLRTVIEAKKNSLRTERADASRQKTWRIALSAGGMAFSERPYAVWPYRANVVSVGLSQLFFVLDPPPIPASMTPEFSLSIERFVLSRWSLVARLQIGNTQKGQNLLIAKNNSQQGTFNLDESYISIGLRSNFYLIREFGFCPFVSAGCDYLSVKRNGITFPLTINNISTLSAIDKKSSNAYSLVAEFGSDYEFSNEFPLYLSASGGIHFVSFPGERTPTASYLLEMRAGMVIL